MYTLDISKTASWNKLQKDLLLEIVKRDWISIEEGALFEAIQGWVRADLKKKGGDEKKQLKAEMEPFLPFIRFTNMDVTTVATKVNPSGLLESQQILDLFTYLGLKNSGSKDVKVPSSLTKFNVKPRTPRKKPDAFKWSESHKWSTITISDNGLTASGGSNQTIGGDITFSKGVHEWEFELKGESSAYAMIGVIPASYASWGSGSHIGDSTINGWGLFLYNPWSRYRTNSSTPISSGASGTGPVVVGMRLDCDKGTMEYFRGGMKGTSVGVVHTDINGEVRPAATLFTGTLHIHPIK